MTSNVTSGSGWATPFTDPFPNPYYQFFQSVIQQQQQQQQPFIPFQPSPEFQQQQQQPWHEPCRPDLAFLEPAPCDPYYPCPVDLVRMVDDLVDEPEGGSDPYDYDATVRSLLSLCCAR